MTDKQIIIDGYNLEYIKELLYNGQRSAISTNIFEAIIEQLECKEQECERLKNLKKCAWKSFEGTFCPEAQQQLDQLKEEKQGLIKDWEEKKNLAYEIACKNEKLKQTLTEIKEIVSSTLDCGEWVGQGDNKMEQILNKISEVEDET